MTFLLAQAALDPASNVLIQYGALGVCVLFMGGIVRYQAKEAQKTLDLERARGDRFEKKCDELTTAIMDRVIPVLTAQTTTVSELVERLERER